MQPAENPTGDPASDQEPPKGLTTDEILGWMEFSCWTMLLLAPILDYVNGASVSSDQFVVRVALVVLSATGAVVLRLMNWRRSKRNAGEPR